MPWIESHVDLSEHPKMYDLCARLKIRKPEAMGLLHMLWHFTMKFAWRDGDLRRFTPKSVSLALDWRGDHDKLFTALRESGWLEDMKIHDWLDYAGKIVRDRLYNEERKSTALRRITPLNGVLARKTAATLPYPTLPNLKEDIARSTPHFVKPTPEQATAYAKSIGFVLDGQRFVAHYEAGGWMRNKTKIKDWKACVRTWRTNGYDNRALGAPPAVPVDPVKLKEAKERIERLRTREWEARNGVKETSL